MTTVAVNIAATSEGVQNFQHANLKTRFECGISHLVFLARYYHTNGTKSLHAAAS